jgi:hypothetical protein
MEPVITELFMGIQEYNNTKGKAYSQTEDIDQRGGTVPDKYPECNFNETGKHVYSGR